MRRLFFVVAALLIPGCLFMGDCGSPNYREARWQEQGLFERAGGLTAATATPVGFPVSLEVPPAVVLVQVAWTPPRNESQLGIVLVRDPGPGNYRIAPNGDVEAYSNDRFAPGRLRSEVLSFLSNVTTADAPQREAWADAFIANRTATGIVQAIPVEGGGWQQWEEFEHRIRVTSVDLSGVLPSAEAWDNSTPKFGGRQVFFRDWVFNFEGPVIERVVDGDQLSIDFQDNAFVEMAAWLDRPADVVNRTRAMFSRLALGEPKLTASDVYSGPIC